VPSNPFASTAGGDGDYVQFWVAGEGGKGEYRCSECSYGVAVRATLPACPVCSGRSWEQAAWRPFTRPQPLQ
jgi:hypothetical protein